MLAAAVLSLRGDARGMWALLVLLTPVGRLGLYPLAENFAPVVGTGYADFRVATGTVAAIFILGGMSLAVAFAVQARSRSSATASVPTISVHGRRPTCGK